MTHLPGLQCVRLSFADFQFAAERIMEVVRSRMVIKSRAVVRSRVVIRSRAIKKSRERDVSIDAMEIGCRELTLGNPILLKSHRVHGRAPIFKRREPNIRLQCGRIEGLRLKYTRYFLASDGANG